jgi:hypothetical protein
VHLQGVVQHTSGVKKIWCKVEHGGGQNANLSSMLIAMVGRRRGLAIARFSSQMLSRGCVKDLWMAKGVRG